MDICFVIPPQNQGWILDRIPHEIGSRHDGKVEYVYRYHDLPKAKCYFLSHYSILPQVLTLNPSIPAADMVVFFTHTSSDLKPYVVYFNKCRKIICENQYYYDELLSAGVLEEKLIWIPEGTDPGRFQPHERKGQGVLISGSFRRRKNFEQVLEIIKAMPDVKFTMVTKGLDKSPMNIEFLELNNLRVFQDLDYEKYAEIYGMCDVYLSCAKVEGGGPNSLIEAMHCNLVPVVSRVGNAEQYIINGTNGFLFEVGEETSNVISLLRKALVFKKSPIQQDIHLTVKDYTWANYAHQMLEYLSPDPISENVSANIS